MHHMSDTRCAVNLFVSLGWTTEGAHSELSITHATRQPGCLVQMSLKDIIFRRMTEKEQQFTKSKSEMGETANTDSFSLDQIRNAIFADSKTLLKLTGLDMRLNHTVQWFEDLKVQRFCLAISMRLLCFLSPVCNLFSDLSDLQWTVQKQRLSQSSWHLGLKSSTSM